MTTRTVRPATTAPVTAAALTELARLLEQARRDGEWIELWLCPFGGVHTTPDCGCNPRTTP